MTDFTTTRRNMVEGQVRTADVTDLRIIAAMLEVPREHFLPATAEGLAYADLDVHLTNAPGRRLLKPRVLSKLIQAGDIKATDRVLDVGCATGYGAAILARLAAEVVALEENAALAGAAKANLSDQPHVSVVTGKLLDGWPVGAPYDAILFEGATEIGPNPLCRQLADGGRLLCVIGTGPAAKASVLCRTGDDIGVRHVFDAAAAVLPGFTKPLEFAF